MAGGNWMNAPVWAAAEFPRPLGVDGLVGQSGLMEQPWLEGAEGHVPPHVLNSPRWTRDRRVLGPLAQSIDREAVPPSQQPWQQPQAPVPSPSPSDLLPWTSPQLPVDSEPELPTAIVVKSFRITGSTVFRATDFDPVTAPFLNRPLTFSDLFQVRDAIGKLYIDRGYITSAAWIPPQKFQADSLEIRVIEGQVEDIRVMGLRRLRPSYVRRRLEIATGSPLNRHRLLEALQLLQLDPLIANVSANLSAGTRPGYSLLEIRVAEANTQQRQIILDNGRSPSVGTLRRKLYGVEANLLGLGDRFSVLYTNTQGSNALDLGYTLPINSRNGTLSFNYGTAASTIIEPPFSVLDIESRSNYYELTLRQPFTRSPTQELAFGLTLTHRDSAATLLDNLPFPAAGADSAGKTKLTAVRFFQEWTQRNSTAVVAVRSQFSLGLPIFDTTHNAAPPDGRFFAWRGQAQWVRVLGKDTLLLLRGDVQLANRPLLPLEQFGLGGLENGRGYRQDILLSDQGVFASAELRFPLYRSPQSAHLLQLTPFAEVGTAWNRGDATAAQTLASVGLGLRWQWNDQLTVRGDWGIPLIPLQSSDRTLQEQGIYFSINYSF